MAINAYGRGVTDRLVLPVAGLLVRLGATANWLTFAGFVGTVAGMTILLAGAPRIGAVVAALAACVDALDGAVARLRGSTSAFGAFYDSVMDRVSDMVLFGTALWLVKDRPVLFAVGLVALGAALVTSYVRAKAESLGWSATVGVVERPERLIILLLALGFRFEALALWILAAGGLVTVAQRLRAVLRQAGRS